MKEHPGGSIPMSPAKANRDMVGRSIRGIRKTPGNPWSDSIQFYGIEITFDDGSVLLIPTSKPDLLIWSEE